MNGYEEITESVITNKNVWKFSGYYSDQQLISVLHRMKKYV